MIIEFEKKDFNIKHIFECGQAFRWYDDGDHFTSIHKGKVIYIREEENKIYINSPLEDFDSKIWEKYFDLKKDYGKIKNSLIDNEELNKAKEFGYGIRILKQDEFETIISFIISANNMIPRIKKSIETISSMYGDLIFEDEKRRYYSFPSPERLASADPKDLRKYARVGFRDERIVTASKMLLEPSFNINLLKNMETDILREKLIELPGVGPKVADCILLFGFGRAEVFPVDVWIKRVMEELFIGEEVPKSKIKLYANKYFGNLAGYAQQYLFYYGRENNIGKERKKRIKQNNYAYI